MVLSNLSLRLNHQGGVCRPSECTVYLMPPRNSILGRRPIGPESGPGPECHWPRNRTASLPLGGTEERQDAFLDLFGREGLANISTRAGHDRLLYMFLARFRGDHYHWHAR